MASSTWGTSFHLESHPTARSRAVASSPLPKGAVVLSAPPIAAVLLDSEKGRRCDTCLRARADLQRCTACKSYWYCDSTCQMIAWKAHHRRLCTQLPVFASSAAYESISPPEKLHSLLLVHLLAEHAKPLLSAFLELSEEDSKEDPSDPISTLLYLLPQPGYKHVIPTIDLDGPVVPDSIVSYISSRFANNNFTIHCARASVFAHGVFPLASRSFNHSCTPCAVPVYRHVQRSKCITMEIRLLRDLIPGEEITIPYTDPALPYPTRKQHLELTYGFTCMCFLCCHSHTPVAPATSPQDLAYWEMNVQENILPHILCDSSPSLELRKEFLRTWHPSYLSQLTESFSNSSHDGPYKLAAKQGEILLVVYSAIYPPNYPMIGLHALELAKTCWNAYLTGNASLETLQHVEKYLSTAEQIFHVVFGDLAGNKMEEEGPISEVKLLRDILTVEAKQVDQMP